jgi:ankyrin repeat protein
MKSIKKKINPLHQELSDACEDDNVDKVRKMINDGIDLKQKWTVGDYPLATAFWRDNVEICSLLVEAGMPQYLNLQQLYKSESVSDIENMHLYGAFDQNAQKASLKLLEFAGIVNTSNPSFHPLVTVSAITDRAISEFSDQYYELAIEKGADVDHPLGKNETMLVHIARESNSKYVPQLIRLSKNIEAHMEERVHATALWEAVSARSVPAVKTLLELGANTTVELLELKSTLLDLAMKRACNFNGKKVLSMIQELGIKTWKEKYGDKS